MRTPLAYAALTAMIAGTAAALIAPPWLAAALIVAGLALVRERRSFLLFASIALAINLAVAAVAIRPEGWRIGLVGGARMVAALAVNLGVVSRYGAPRLLDDLRLPPRATALLAAILLAAHDVGRDFGRLRDARVLEGAWPSGRFARAREAARLVPALVVAAHRRAEIRRDALALAGHPTAPWFVPLVAVAALAAAGRLAFLALPNVALTYLVAFLGGLLFGPFVAAAGAFVGMALTDVLLSGLYPGGFVNAPAMALLGLAGGALRGLRRIDPALAASIGVFSTFLFSIAADSLTWLLVYPGAPEAWLPLVLLGLAFNVLPALVNGALFAAATGPTQRAFEAWRRARRQGAPPGEALASPATPPAAAP